jgi:hypothetical protein
MLAQVGIEKRAHQTQRDVHKPANIACILAIGSKPQQATHYPAVVVK